MCYDFFSDFNTLYNIFRVYTHLRMGVSDFHEPPEIDGRTSRLALALFTCIFDVMSGTSHRYTVEYPEPCLYYLERLFFRILPSLGFVFGVAGDRDMSNILHEPYLYNRRRQSRLEVCSML